jgi:hypothetical protein
VGKALAVHVGQAFEDLANYDTDILLWHRPSAVHVPLEVAKGEVFHSNEHMVVGAVPSEELDEAFGVLLLST